MESAQRFCSVLDELRQYLRIRLRSGEQVSLSERRRVFLARWQALTAEMAAAKSVRITNRDSSLRHWCPEF